MGDITILAIDLAKNVFQLHGVNHFGKPILKKKLSRAHLSAYVAQLPACTVAMEACSGANHWARTFQEFGHKIILLSPQHVKPFVQGSKNDANDARAIAIAAQQPDMPTVPIKSRAQQDIQLLHRIRERNVLERTALCNQIRGFLAEFGVAIKKGIGVIRRELLDVLADASNKLTHTARREIHALYQKLQCLDAEVNRFDEQLNAIVKNNPGVGVITATIVFANLGAPEHFKNGRQFAAYLGLVPKEHSSGGKHRLMGITKRGNRYIRSLLIHGGRSVTRMVDKKHDKLSQWVKRIKDERGYNKASVAVANKNARMLWAMMSKGDSFVLMSTVSEGLKPSSATQ
jgi:transposase